jgi:hypothetical protein
MKTYQISLSRTQGTTILVDEDEIEPGQTPEEAAWALVGEDDWARGGTLDLLDETIIITDNYGE